MPAPLSLNTFLHSASLLLHAYPTSHITTKYSLPKPSKSKTSTPADAATSTTTDTNNAPAATTTTAKREPSATLTVKIYHPQTGICLKYSTDKAQEVGRLFTSLGRLARGETIELPSAAAAGTGGDAAAGGDAMEVDSGTQVAVKDGDGVVAAPPAASGGQQGQGQQGGGGGGGGGKKKKGKGGKR